METGTIIYIIAGILSILGLMFALSKKKRVMEKSKWIFALPLLFIGIGLIAMQTGYLQDWTGSSTFAPLTAGLPGENQNEPANLNVDVTGCDLGTKATITLSAVDKYTDVAVGGYHQYRINGAPIVALADKGTFTASPGDKLTILWHNSTTGYFSAVSNEEVPCTGAKTFYTLIAQNGTLTTTLKDSDDNSITSGGANNQSLAAGDVKDVSLKLSGQFQRDYPYGFVATVEYNSTSIDDVRLSTTDGIELTPAVIPQSVTSTLATESSRKAYNVPAIISNADLYLKVTIDADDTNNPAVVGSNVLITLSPKNYFINENTGSSFDGPAAEDEDRALTRGAGTLVTITVD